MTVNRTIPYQNSYFNTKISEKLAYYCKRAPRVNFN